MTRDVFMAEMANLTAVFDRKLLPAAIEGYWNSLQNLSDAEMRQATDRAAMECKYMPVPSVLWAFVRAARERSPQATNKTPYRCQSHRSADIADRGDGRPDSPSTNPTAWWCDRCSYFVSRGLQESDWTAAERERMARGARGVVIQLADHKSDPTQDRYP